MYLKIVAILFRPQWVKVSVQSLQLNVKKTSASNNYADISI